MAGAKTTTKFDNTNTFDYKSPPINEQAQKFIDYNPGTQLLDPALEQQYAASRKSITEGYGGPGSGITSSVLRGKLRDLGLQELSSQQAQAQRGGAQDAYNRQGQHLLQSAAMTAPQLVQTGGSGTQTSQQTGGFWRGLLNNFAQGAGQTGAMFAGGA